MPIAGFLHTQRDFSAGQVDGTGARRHDTEILKAAALKMEETEIMLTGGFRRRSGTQLKFYGGPKVKRVQPAPQVFFDVEFTAFTFRARDDDGNVQTLAAPWNATRAAALNFDLFDNKLIAVAHGMRPQVIEYDEDAGTWSIRDFTFQVGPNGMLRQPFYRFADKGITMQPSTADIGAGVTVTFSDPVLKSAMIGVEFRWLGRRLKMTARTSATVGTFENLEELPPSQHLNMTAPEDMLGYRLYDAIEGVLSGAQGFVIAIDDVGLHLDVVVTHRFSGFFFDISNNRERIVGPDAEGRCDGAAFIPPLAVTYWEEAFMSDFRGWPGNIMIDRQRVVFFDFLQLPGAIVWSEVGQFDGFDIGEKKSNSTSDVVDPSSGIFEISPKRERVIQMAGGPDQFAFTEDAIYYIPISASNPLASGNVQFLQMGNGGVSAAVRPVQTSSAILYVSLDGQRIMAVRATGQVTAPYQLAHTSRYHSELIKTPIDMAVSLGQTQDSGEVVFIVNDDGTIIVGRYNAQADFVGYVPWSTAGTGYVGVATHGEVVLLMAKHTSLYTVETLDQTATLDCEIVTADKAGGPELIPCAGVKLDRIVNGLYMGSARPDATGFANVDHGPEGARWGFRFDPKFQPFIRNFEGGWDQAQRMRRRKIKGGAVTVRDSGPFRVGKTDLAGYKVGDDFSLPPPLRSDTFLFRVQGRSFEPTFELVQEQPYPLKVIEIAAEVTS